MTCVINPSTSGNVKYKRTENFSGTTDSSGNFSIVYDIPFLAPYVIPVFTGVDAQTEMRISNLTNLGFTVVAMQRSIITVLGLNVLSFATTNTAGIPVQVTVLEAG